MMRCPREQPPDKGHRIFSSDCDGVLTKAVPAVMRPVKNVTAAPLAQREAPPQPTESNMKSTISSRNGQPPTISNGKAARPQKTKGPLLKVHTGGKKPTLVNPALADDTDWVALRNRCDQADGPVILEIFNLPKWSDDGRYSLLTMAKVLERRCRLPRGKQTYGDPFEAVLVAMPGPKSMNTHRQGLHAAIEAAALFHGDMPDTAAKRINDRLAEVVTAKINYPRLVKQIHEIAGAAKADKQADAHAAAQAFLVHLAEAGKAVDEQPMLRYFQADFFVWTGNAWIRQEDKNFEVR